jgi:hypothetical protein
VRHLPGSFQEQQAAVWCGEGQPPAPSLLYQMVKVLPRLKSEQGKLKPLLPAACLCVAHAHIAAGLREHGHDIVHEAHRPLRRQEVMMR